MAADILIYDSNIVPGGARPEAARGGDARPRGEDERALRQRFSSSRRRASCPALATIPGLDGQKMSKSYDNTIELFEEEKALRKKIMGIVTDSTPVEAPKDPAQSPRSSRSTGSSRAEADVAQMEADFRAGGIGYGDFKKRLFGAIWESFAPMRARRAELARRSRIRGPRARRRAPRERARSPAQR